MQTMFESIQVGGNPVRFLKGQEAKVKLESSSETLITEKIDENVQEQEQEPDVVDFDDPVSFIEKLPKDFYKLLVIIVDIQF